MIEKLKRIGLKTTPIRKSIIAQLEKNHSNLQASDLITKLKLEGIANEATIYRALHDLSRANMLHSFAWEGQTIYYLCQLESHEHVTITYCIRCKEVKEINNQCSQNHSNLLSDRREIIVNHCQSCQ